MDKASVPVLVYVASVNPSPEEAERERPELPVTDIVQETEDETIPEPEETPEDETAPGTEETPEDEAVLETEETPGAVFSPVTVKEDPDPPPSPEPDLLPLWTGLGGALLMALLAAAFGLWRRERRKRAARRKQEARGPIEIQVSKLHQQGARPSQQDSFSVSPAELLPTYGMLAVVADGMGGLQDGDKVSQATVSAMANGFLETGGTPRQVLLSLLRQANQAVNWMLGEDGQRRSGSTVAAGLIRDGVFHWMSVGDSRICLYRDGVLYQLNREHVFQNELEIRAVNGAMPLQEAAQHPKAAGLTSYLGMGQLKYVDLPAQPIAIRSGDVFVIMSDGVYNALTNRELTAALDSGEDPAKALHTAIENKRYSSQDNYTAVILRCRRKGKRKTE